MDAEVLIKFKGDTTEADSAIQKQESNFSQLQKSGELAFLGLTAAADAFAISVLKSGINYNAEIETYLTRLETLTGSADEANTILDQIKKDALATPFEVSSLTQAESLLLSTGLSAEQSRADILALGDAIAASGGGNEELQRMAVNLQQIKNVGKASALDIKQFAYAGIDIYGLLADSMGVTREEASQMTVTYDMLSTALQQASQKGGKYYGAMDKQSKTYKGAMSNLGESINVLTGELSQGFFEAIKGVIPLLTDFFNWLGKNKDLVLAIAIPLLTFVNIFSGFLIIKKVVGLFSALWAVIMANPIGAIIAVVAALVAGFIYLWNTCEGFRNFFIGLWDGIVSVAAGAWEGIKNVFGSVASFFTSVFGGAWNAVKNIFSTGGKIFTGIKDGIVSTFKTIVNGIIKGINTVVSIPFKAINGALKGLKGIKIVGMKPFGWLPTIPVPKIPLLNVGTNFVPEDQLAMIHKGEAVIPKKFNPYANNFSGSTLAGMQNGANQPIINVYVESNTDPLGQTVSHIKTFSGGAKNDYNYGMGV